MEIDFQELMARKSDEDLQRYISDSIRYVPESVEAAISELKKRGQTISVIELDNINSGIEQKKKNENSVSYSRLGRNIVTDIDAPLFYSDRVIWYFSCFFGTITGAILLAINIRNAEKKNGILAVLIFGIGYQILTILLAVFLVRSGYYFPGSSILINGIGWTVLIKYFWRKHIGSDTKYRAKPFVIPLSICAILGALYIAYIIHTNGN